MIKTDVLKKYRQAALDLNKQFKTGRFKSLRPERAFIEWYVEARFGSLRMPHILDGKKDGGIDAIVDVGETIFVLQSKYEVTSKVSPVTRNEIGEFQNLARKFKDSKSEDEYSNWIETVRPQLRTLYNKVHQRAIKDPKHVRFIFITTKRSDYGEDELYEIEDIQNISALWYLYAEGFTPPTEHIDLILDSAWFTSSDKGRYKTYVGLADVKSFLHLMKDDENERLFAQNVRTNLHSKVNEYIRKTYEDEPDLFWLCNNGIYIVCKRVQASGNQYRLTYPSVINGSQTLHSIAESNKNHSCKVLVRILEMDILGDPKLLSAVVRRTNTQNTMKLINLFAHDSAQLNVATYLDRFRIFYERREKEWQNERKTMLSGYLPVNTKNVAQWLSIQEPSIGLGVARAQVSTLFDDENYQHIFGNFGTNFQSPNYENLIHVISSGLFVDNLIRHLPDRMKAFAKISRLLLVKAVYNSIQESQALKNSVTDMLTEHRFGRKYIPSPVLKIMKNVINQTKSIQRKEQNKDPNVDYSNFFKRNNLIEMAYASAGKPALISRLANTLVKSADKIL
jgi:hypothetical protein